MNIKTILSSIYLVSIISLFIGCNSNTEYRIEKSEHSAIIYQDSMTVQIEIIDDAIVHIKKYLPGEVIAPLPDYVTVLKPQSPTWKIIEKEDEIIIETSKVKVVLHEKGIIKYFTKEGEEILSESDKSTYLKQGNSAYSVSQSFESEDEGLYGLGQYQSGIMNWKNVPVRLQQYNQEIAIPFFVSTNNYGIYWHNYSVTDFNYPENEIIFTETTDEEKNIRKTSFVPKKDGLYTFLLESENPEENRFKGDISLTIDSDTIIHYTTVWVPDCFSGKKVLKAGQKYEVVFQNSDSQVAGKVLFNEPDFNKTVISSRQGEAIDYYFIYGENPSGIISEYSRLTGKAPMFPKSAFGFWQCRERYHSQEELLENAKQYRTREIPIDNIVQDWNYWPDSTWGPEWNREKYPNPKQMVDELNDMNLNLMVSVWPRVENKTLFDKYKFGEKEFETYLDFTNPSIQKSYYKMLKDSMFNIGVASIWLDGTEPEIKPDGKYKLHIGNFEDVANCYSLLVNKAVYEGKRKDFPNKRVFNLTRSSYAGQQRYGAASWSGDVDGTWEQFAEQIPAGLNFMMAGVPYWTTDIGGFFRDSISLNPIYKDQYKNKEYIELLTRWFQFGAFNPLFRIHGYKSNTEIWRYGQEFEEMARDFINLRYQLMPYIYSEAKNVTTKGTLLMSPLVYHYPKDKNTWEIKDQFFFGSSILVSPIIEYKARSRALYLPDGDWYNYWTNEKLEGEKEIVAKAPLNRMPLFIKAGTILPIGPKVQYTTQETNEPIKIKIYPGNDAEYTLYLDDNKSFDYEKGIFSEIVMSYSESNKSISFNKGEGEFINFEKAPQKFVIELIGTDVSKDFSFVGDSLEIALK